MQMGLLSLVIISLPGSGCGQGKVGAVVPPPMVEVVNVLRQNVPTHSEQIPSTDGTVNPRYVPRYRAISSRNDTVKATSWSQGSSREEGGVR
jgi:hypothetical protein